MTLVSFNAFVPLNSKLPFQKYFPTDMSDCNNIPLGAVLYVYANTANNPLADIGMVLCYGVNDSYRVQIAIGRYTKYTRMYVESTWYAWM